MLFVNYANLLPQTYERYLESAIRDEYDMTGLPVHFRVRSRRDENAKPS